MEDNQSKHLTTKRGRRNRGRGRGRYFSKKNPRNFGENDREFVKEPGMVAGNGAHNFDVNGNSEDGEHFDHGTRIRRGLARRGGKSGQGKGPGTSRSGFLEQRGHRRRKNRQKVEKSMDTSSLRADAAVWLPKVGFNTYAKIASTKAGNGEEAHAPCEEQVPEGFEPLPKKSISKLLLFRRQEEKMVLEKERRQHEFMDEFVGQTIASGIESYLDYVETNRKRVVKERFVKRCTLWKQYLEESNFEEEDERIATEKKKRRKREKTKQIQQTEEVSEILEEEEEEERNDGADELEEEAPADDGNVSARADAIEILEICGNGDVEGLLQWANLHQGTNSKRLTTLLDRYEAIEDSPLGRAMMRGHYEVVQVLLDFRVKLDFKSTKSKTSALHFAATIGDETCVRILLDHLHIHGVQRGLAAKDSKGQIPLHCACKHMNVDACKLLLEAGSSPTAKDREGNTPLHLAAMLCSASTEHVLEAFFASSYTSKRTSVDAKNKHGETPLHLASRCGNEKAITTLIRCGANVDALDANFNTPLCLAVKEDHMDASVLLILKGASIKILESENDGVSFSPSPLNIAASRGFVKLVDAILETKGSIDDNDAIWPGDTLLMSSIRAGQWECCQYLIDRGASLTKTNLRREFPLFVAILSNRNVPARILRKLACKEALGIVEEYPTNRKISALQYALRQALVNPSEKHPKSMVSMLLSMKQLQIQPECFFLSKELVRICCENRWSHVENEGDHDNETYHSKTACSLMFKNDLFVGNGDDEEGVLYKTPREQLYMEVRTNFDACFAKSYFALYNDKATSDVVLVLDNGKLLFAHKAILRSRCPYFDGLFRFTHSYASRIEMEQYPAKILRWFVRYLYGVEIKTLFEPILGSGEEKFQDGRFVLDVLQFLIDLMVFANEMLVHSLEKLVSQCVGVVLHRHFQHKKRKYRLGEEHLESVLELAQSFQNEDLEGVIGRIQAGKNNDKMVDRDHPLECQCTLRLLKDYQLEYCRVEGEEQSVVVDMKSLFLKLRLHGERLWGIRPSQLMRHILDSSHHFATIFTGHDAPFLSDYVETLMMIRDQVLPCQCNAVRLSQDMQSFFEANKHSGEIDHRLEISFVSTGEPSIFMDPIIFNQRCAIKAKGKIDTFVPKKAWEGFLSFLYSGQIQAPYTPASIQEAMNLIQLGEEFKCSEQFYSCLQAILEDVLLAEVGNDQAPLSIMDMIVQNKLHPCLWSIEERFRQRLLSIRSERAIPAHLGQLLTDIKRTKPNLQALSNIRLCYYLAIHNL